MGKDHSREKIPSSSLPTQSALYARLALLSFSLSLFPSLPLCCPVVGCSPPLSPIPPPPPPPPAAALPLPGSFIRKGEEIRQAFIVFLHSKVIQIP